MIKSAGVVIGSYALSVVLVLLTDPLLSRLFPGDYEKGRTPSNTALIAGTTLFVAVSILCAWICARFTQPRAAQPVLWFFIIGETMGIISTIPNWGKGWPHWYWLSWLLTWPLSCWLGLVISKRSNHALVEPRSAN